MSEKPGIRKYLLKTTSDHRGLRLDSVLATWLPTALARPVSKAKVRKLVVAGAVYLNGRRVRIASKELMPNARVEVYVDLRKLFELENASAGGSKTAFEMTPDRVLFEDEFLIVVNKPPGLPTQPTLDEARVNLFSAVKKFISTRDGMVQPYVALHHRLDRDTSGVILFVKAKEANAGVARMFSEHLAQKTYHALVGIPSSSHLLPSHWAVRNFLGKLSSSGGKQSKFGAVKAGGDPAQTEFICLDRFGEKAAWIEAKPITGRTHQIRVHLSEGGTPILGDSLYGGGARASSTGTGFVLSGSLSRAARVPRMMLHAARLTFPHPIHQTQVVVECPLPEDFRQCIEALR